MFCFICQNDVDFIECIHRDNVWLKCRKTYASTITFTLLYFSFSTNHSCHSSYDWNHRCWCLSWRQQLFRARAYVRYLSIVCYVVSTRPYAVRTADTNSGSVLAESENEISVGFTWHASVVVSTSAWHAAVRVLIPCSNQACYIRSKTCLSTLETVYICANRRRH